MNRYPNCSTELNGPYCHECGQHQEDLDRPIRELASEGLSAFFALRRVYGQSRLLTSVKFVVCLSVMPWPSC